MEMDTPLTPGDTVQYENNSDTVILSDEKKPSQDESGTLFVTVGGQEYKYFKPIFTSKEDWNKRLDVIKQTQRDFDRPRPTSIPEDKWKNLQEQRQKGLLMLANATTAKDAFYMGSESRRGYALLTDVQFQERMLANDQRGAKEITDQTLAELKKQDQEALSEVESQYNKKRDEVLAIRTKQDQNNQRLAEVSARRKVETEALADVAGQINGKDVIVNTPDGQQVTQHQTGLQEQQNQALQNSKDSVDATEKKYRGHAKRWEKEYKKQNSLESYDPANESLENRLKRLQKLEEIWKEKVRKAIFKGRARKSLEIIQEQLQQAQTAADAKGRLDIAVNQLNTIRANIRVIDNDEKEYQTVGQTLEAQFKTTQRDEIDLNTRAQELRVRIRRAENLQNQRQAS